MDIKNMLEQFKKYGAIGQLVSFAFFCVIFFFAYPVIRDFKLFVVILSFSVTAFIILYIYYISWINRRIIKLFNRIDESGAFEKLTKNLAGAGTRIFYLQMAALTCIYAPVLIIMYVYLGYMNLYYHFYVFFISFFIILYSGYFTRNIWYVRIYPLGKLNIPVPVQRLRSKIVSLISPVILLVNVIISVLIYLLYSSIIISEIDDKVSMILDRETYILEKTEDYSSFQVSEFCRQKEGSAFIAGMDGEIFFSFPEKGHEGKNIADLIERGDKLSYLYEPTVESLKLLYQSSFMKFEGVYRSNQSVFISRKIGNTGKALVYVFRENLLYDSFYLSIFLFTVMLFILNFFIWFIVNRRLRTVSDSIDTVMPAITGASKGDLTQTIRVVKSRDVLEDFTRVFAEHIKNIRGFMVMGRELSKNLIELADKISNIGEYIGDSSIGHADLLKKSTDLIKQILSALAEIAKNSESQNTSIQNFEDTIEKLSISMNDVSENTSRVVESMGTVNASAQDGAALVENTFEGILNIEKLYEGILAVSRLISDIADRVNLLSLNASIEAARAGEHGRGFAVVAEEISKLADGTGSRAKEISGLINEGNEEVIKDKEMVTDMKQTFGGIMENININSAMIRVFIGMIHERVEEIEKIKTDITSISMYANSLSLAAQELNSNATSVNDSIELVNDGAQRFAERSERLTESSQQLSDMAQYLTEFLKEYKI